MHLYHHQCPQFAFINPLVPCSQPSFVAIFLAFWCRYKNCKSDNVTQIAQTSSVTANKDWKKKPQASHLPPSCLQHYKLNNFTRAIPNIFLHKSLCIFGFCQVNYNFLFVGRFLFSSNVPLNSCQKSLCNNVTCNCLLNLLLLFLY